MAGTLLGPDQVRKLNAAYPALVAHIRTLLVADHSPVALMRVHVMVETFDSDQMAAIFREISFISPFEKRALVRAAIYELMAWEPALFIAPAIGIDLAVPGAERSVIAVKPTGGPVVMAEYKPSFTLNINKAESFHGQKPSDTPPPAPVVTSTHTSKSAAMLEEGKKQATDQQAKLDAAVAKLREASTPKPIDVMATPEDVNLQDESEE